MSLDVTNDERDFLLELLEARHTSMLHELHHTDTYQYKELLQHKLALLEKLRQKLEHMPSQATI